MEVIPYLQILYGHWYSPFSNLNLPRHKTSTFSTQRATEMEKNLFLNFTLHFILIGNGTQISNFPPFFNTILSLNPDTPIVLDYFKTWNFFGSKFSPEIYMNPSIPLKSPPIAKLGHPSVISFIDLYRFWGPTFLARIHNRFNSLTNLLLAISATGLNPAYIFIHSSMAELLEIQNPSLIYPAIGLTSKFSVWQPFLVHFLHPLLLPSCQVKWTILTLPTEHHLVLNES